jgi:glutamate dehydrogenase
MLTRAREQKVELVERVVGLLHDRLAPDRWDEAERFVRRYYEAVPPEDLADRSAGDLYGAALSHWSFAQTRQDGQSKVRVYNPTLEDHGWQSDHTIVEVVNDDMPFLVDSVSAELNRHDLMVHLIIHPVFGAMRDGEGRLTGLADSNGGAEGARRESLIHIEVDQHTAEAYLDELTGALEHMLDDVRAVVDDWQEMTAKLGETTERFTEHAPDLPEDQVEEVIAFLGWLLDNHFTFLGYREYALTQKAGEIGYRVVKDSGLGLLRHDGVDSITSRTGEGALPPEVSSFVHAPRILMINKSNSISIVHRPVHMDIVCVKTFDEAGRVKGERRFVGLFTSAAYNRSPMDIPLLRRRVSRTIERAGFAPGGHDGKTLLNILERFPRDELFQISSEELFEMSLAILHLQERQRTRLFARSDAYERFVSCLVYVPRDRFNTDLRLRMEAILETAFAGRRSSFTTQLSDEPLARIHFIIQTTPGEIPDIDTAEVETRLVAAVQTWDDALRHCLIEHHGEERGVASFNRFRNAFPTAYREDFDAQIAVLDIEKIESIDDGGGSGFAMNLYCPVDQAPGLLKFKLYRVGNPVPLSDILPPLEHMGLRMLGERPYEVQTVEGVTVWMHDFNLVTREVEEIDLLAVKQKFHDTFARVWTGGIEDDGFNRLVLEAGLTWREVVILRAYCKYLRQAGVTFSQDYMEQTLAANSGLTRALVELFMARLDPARAGHENKQAVNELIAEINDGLDAVASLDEDRILRHYLSAIEATLRTNYFQPAADGGLKPYLSFKLDSQALDELPLPRPHVEVFVYSPRMEGIHLRGGSVARGGIRWSDRREDFRTEVLGLMKAQMVKNAVIVPVGAKGGFVCKQMPAEAGRDAQQEEGIACYRMLIDGLLDLTDNLVEGALVPPPDLVRYDGDDSYLVVAADKGTATFSDIANEISTGRGFWLGDAFASGGAAGYDHKKMGITARGAWESVKRHFRELGTDIQKTDFTVVGIGGMTGDVFGNGMLLSKHIRLLAAFDHMHIILDPDPDPAASFAERKRLFGLPRSSWADYKTKVLSKGGGVFERSAKSVVLSEAVKERFGLNADRLTPSELIRALLRTEVDLLWLGGIGTFVKAGGEGHAEVGDRANDGLRVDARELGAQVVGEGANLGLTQRARIEYAARGGRINTDAIDNSAGVDCSDHEVNIKVALDQVVAAGDMTLKQRDALLGTMTDEVADLVLRDNYLQTQAIGIAEAQASAHLEYHARLMRMLEKAGLLNRAVEFLPNDEELAERGKSGGGLTRPEIAVLLAYAKNDLFARLRDSDVPEDTYLGEDLVRYFPAPMRERYGANISEHRLRREIIATSVANSLVNRAGPAFVHWLSEETGRHASDIARAYAAARQVFDMRGFWGEIEALDNAVPTPVQVEMLAIVHRLVEHTNLWFLRNRPQPLDIAQTIEDYAPGVRVIAENFETIFAEEELALVATVKARLTDAGVPETLARRVAAVDGLIPACGIVDVAKGFDLNLEDVAGTYFEIGVRLGFDWLRTHAEELLTRSHWQRRAVNAIVDDLYSQQTALTASVLTTAAGESGAAAIECWIDANRLLVESAMDLLEDIKTGSALDLSMLAVANRQIRSLIVR